MDKNNNKKTLNKKVTISFVIVIVGMLVCLIYIIFLQQMGTTMTPLSNLPSKLTCTAKKEYLDSLRPKDLLEKIKDPKNKGKFIVVGGFDINSSLYTNFVPDEKDKDNIFIYRDAGYLYSKTTGKVSTSSQMELVTLNTKTLEFSEAKKLNFEEADKFYEEYINPKKDKSKEWKYLQDTLEKYKSIGMLAFFEPLKINSELFPTIINNNLIVTSKGEEFQHNSHLPEPMPDYKVVVIDLNKEKIVFQGKAPNWHWGTMPIWLKNGKILFIGGKYDTFNRGAYYQKKADILDLKSKRFYETGSLNYGRFSPRTIPLEDGNILVISTAAEIKCRPTIAEIYIAE